MAEKHTIFFETPPKKIEYINKLLNYDQKNTLLEKAKKYFTKKDETRPHTKGKWCKILGKRKTNPDTRKFLEKLIQENALKKTNNSDPIKYSLDRNRLIEVYYNSVLYNHLRDINIETINKKEPNKKVVTDI